VPQREPVLVTPFWVRVATETSLAPGWLLIAFPAVLYPTYLLLEVLFGRGLGAATHFSGDFQTRMMPVWAAGLGYLAMAGTYEARGTFRDLEALRPVLREGDAAYHSLRDQLTRFERRRLWIGALVGAILFLAVAELMAEHWTRFLAGEWSVQAICIGAAGFACYIIGFRLCVYVIDAARLYSRIGEQQVGLTAGVAALLFVLPVRGLRCQIRARKAEKLAQLQFDIRHNEELMAGSGTQAAEAGAKMPGLLAYMNQIESVREWPFDAPTLTRFLLYIAIPLGSWVGGALVERLLGVVLD